MAFQDIEMELEARIIVGMQRIFVFDDEFMYNENEDQTKVIVTPEYPDIESPFKAPHIVVTSIGYQSSSTLAMGSNFVRDVDYSGIQNYASEYLDRVSYTATLMCMGSRDISRNLANRVFYYSRYRARNYLSDGLALGIENVVKGQTSLREQQPEKIFQTPVSIQGTMMLKITETPFNYLRGNDMLGKPISSIKVSVSDK